MNVMRSHLFCLTALLSILIMGRLTCRLGALDTGPSDTGRPAILGYCSRMSGEETHEKGREGARRAKEWLESTTRVNACWVNPDRLAVRKLTFPWAGSDRQPFSYDLGGLLRRGDLEGQNFYAEVKSYRNPRNHQAAEYEEYLAKSYCAYVSRPEYCDSFMWITWHPFSSTKWEHLCSAETVFEAVVKHRTDTLGIADEGDAAAAVDRVICKAVADRLWLIVLSDKQEMLTVSAEHRGLIEQHDTARGVR